MLLAHEGAILVLGTGAVHNGVALWLQNVLSGIGLGQYLLLPVVTCAILIGWHYVQRHKWRFSPRHLFLMAGEAIAWALLLWAVYRGYAGLVGVAESSQFQVAELFGYFGAGIYEELLFRVAILSGIAAIISAAGADRRASLVTAILVSAALFACVHYSLFIPGGRPFSWAGIAFHLLCGIYLGTLFVFRGFGITAAAHALFNIAVVALRFA